MNSNYTSIKFKKWLDKLQQESWQLELLISGFAIFGLTTALPTLLNKINEAVIQDSPFLFLYSFLNTSCYILILNLLIHVIFRGLWIGTIGLRYVSGDIDYDSLNYNEKFTKYLKNKVGTFDKYISNLEDLCSILFAITFLVLFYFIAFFIFALLITLIGAGIQKFDILPSHISKIIVGFLFLITFLLYFIIFVDFITFGFLKKKKWTTFFYLPLYKFFSYITLSFLYRPLLYNFLDNKFGKRILILLIPLYFSISFFSKTQNIQSNYIIKQSYTSSNFSNNNNYLNLVKENKYVKNVAINSKVIDKSYLKIFIVFKKEIEDILFKKNIELVPKKDRRGITNTFFSSRKTKESLKKTDSLYTSYLKTFNNVYQLKIDTIPFTSDFIITEINKQMGFETVLPLKNISEGKHLLKIKRINFSEEEEEEEIIENIIEIPFWYYKK